jgi:solute carrier family 25 carnitine/acylcarnitine transporter 20/29
MAPALHKGLTGVTIALFESIVTCPMERIKCQLMT